MLSLYFVLAALVLAVIYGCLAGFVLWKMLIAFAASFVLVNALAFLGLRLLSVGVDIKKPIEKQSRACRAGAVFFCRVCDEYLRIKTSVSGLEKLPKDRRFLFICNHVSMCDPLTTYAALRDYNIAFVSKPENTKIPVLWRLAYGLGFLPVNRTNDREALRTVLTAANYIKKDICSIGIYPEGRRSISGEMLPFRAGALKIAQKAGAPIVVASIKGTEALKRNFPFRRTPVQLDILDVIPAGKVREMATTEISDYCCAMIEKNLKGEREA